ncbi:hypothetical protein FGO68_gene31 [Halteria grandinella]|uniref:Uncharacterized protein n=1 Tax=Halteria grandinella TaxID=5974 RepID=A0A8J8NGP9_HALGN|nr:hypothetical protein FGO68_gene31 [Halteria grandinella]
MGLQSKDLPLQLIVTLQIKKLLIGSKCGSRAQRLLQKSDQPPSHLHGEERGSPFCPQQALAYFLVWAGLQVHFRTYYYSQIFRLFAPCCLCQSSLLGTPVAHAQQMDLPHATRKNMLRILQALLPHYESSNSVACRQQYFPNGQLLHLHPHVQ